MLVPMPLDLTSCCQDFQLYHPEAGLRVVEGGVVKHATKDARLADTVYPDIALKETPLCH